MNSYDVIVVGVGAMGSAACWELARRGVKVLGIEQFDIPHALGSSHGQSRMIRLAYYEHPDYVPLLRRAYELWDVLERESGQKLLHLTGGLYMGRPQGDVVSGALGAARLHGLEHELLSHGELARRFPMFRLPEDHVGVWEPQAGFLEPEKVIAAYAQGALMASAELHGREAVVEWGKSGQGVFVRTDRARYEAARVIFSSGAWSGKLLGELGVKLRVTRQPMAWFAPRRPELFGLGKFSVWGIEQPDGSLAYGFPIMPGFPGLKLARHGVGMDADADTVQRGMLPRDEQECREIINRYLPDADGPLLAMRICMYTYSPDSHFIIDRHPGNDRAYIACGFSGHGFKFASVMGEVLADLATAGATRLPIGFLGLSRFVQT